MIAPTTLLLLRHAEVEARYQRIFGGKIDMNLSPLGHEQAAALARFLQRKPFAALYASPMKRVQQTILPLVSASGCQPMILEGLREIDFGDWTGLGWEQITEKFKVSPFDWLKEIENGTVANAETDATFRSRVEPCVRQILRDHPGQTVAVACHGGTIRMILSILLAMPLSRMACYEIEYASLTQIFHSPEKTEIQLLNFTPWRDLP